MLFIDYGILRFQLKLETAWVLPFHIDEEELYYCGLLHFRVILQNVRIGGMGRIYYCTVRRNVIFHFSFAD